ncbi:hypothetical protein [Ferrimonas gelatinilytica]|uniref:Ig-like domain-containing protein n=1 Tax=Ferrimonas gelatinilytica TaxID=1255257 RepID=A0ABP9RYR9_9GAMM
MPLSPLRYATVAIFTSFMMVSHVNASNESTQITKPAANGHHNRSPQSGEETLFLQAKPTKPEPCKDKENCSDKPKPIGGKPDKPVTEPLECAPGDVEQEIREDEHTWLRQCDSSGHWGEWLIQPNLVLAGPTEAASVPVSLSYTAALNTEAIDPSQLEWQQLSNLEIETITEGSEVQVSVGQLVQAATLRMQARYRKENGYEAQQVIETPLYPDLKPFVPQNIRYGDEPVQLEVTGGHTGAYRYTSLTPDVVSIDASGMLSIKYVGHAEIQVIQLADGVYPQLEKSIAFEVGKTAGEQLELDSLELYFGDPEVTLELPPLGDQQEVVIASSDPYVVAPYEAENQQLLAIRGEGEALLHYEFSETDTHEAGEATQAVTVHYAVFSEPRVEAPISELSTNSIQTYYQPGDTLSYRYRARLINTTQDRTQCARRWTDQRDEQGYWITKEYCVEPGEQIDLPGGEFSARQSSEGPLKIIWDTEPLYLPFTPQMMSLDWNRCYWEESQHTYVGYTKNSTSYSGKRTCALLYHPEPLEWRSWRVEGEDLSVTTFTFSQGNYSGMIETVALDQHSLAYLKVNRTRLDTLRRNSNGTEEPETCKLWFNPEVGPVRAICDDKSKDDSRRSSPRLEVRLELIGIAQQQ